MTVKEVVMVMLLFVSTAAFVVWLTKNMLPDVKMECVTTPATLTNQMPTINQIPVRKGVWI